ncbi:MAG: nitrilase-related carbon-nitrogen hydrolase [Pseudomonadota bacterium]|nr:nitrilase-related carbon-nitrogen hydrolase [Pseudomonadota bacterium]
MSRIVKAGLIQVANKLDTAASCDQHRNAMIEAHIPYIVKAGQAGVKMLCFQEIFTGPYFCPSQDKKWYGLAEAIPDGPTTKIMCEYAKKYSMVIVVPIYEEHMTGVYYNTAAVIDADGKYLGKYRKNHIPQVAGFWEKFFFKPGNLGYPVFKTAYGNVGVYICYDRHFPEGARALGLNGAEIIFNPSATVAGLSQYLWELEQPAHAAANGYFVGAINRVGKESPWNIGEFYGSSYFANPRGKIIAKGSSDKDELVMGELNFDEIKEVRDLWQFYRDRRPETYKTLTDQ